MSSEDKHKMVQVTYSHERIQTGVNEELEPSVKDMSDLLTTSRSCMGHVQAAATCFNDFI